MAVLSALGRESQEVETMTILIIDDEPAITENVSILQPVVWRQIYGITVWNILVMSIVIFMGKSIFGLEYDNSD